MVSSAIEPSRSTVVRLMNVNKAIVDEPVRILFVDDEQSVLKALQRMLVDDDFTGILDGPKLWQRLPVICSKKQVVDLLEAPSPKETYYLRDRAMLELLYATGVRASELAGYLKLDC